MADKQKYKIIEKIDIGGMAEIYKGKAMTVQGIEKVVAIKRILPSLTKSNKFVSMFLDEARLSIKLNHNNIVQVFDVGRSGGTYFIIMELVNGTNLKKLMERCEEQNCKIPTKIALYIINQVCKGLDYAHSLKDENGKSLNVVHRDVTPGNILISKSGEIKVTDFGLAKAMTQVHITDPGIIKGKFSYLSPEAVNSQTIDKRSDIFSLGIILWELITGRKLFNAETEAKIIDLIKNPKIPNIKTINPDIDYELESIVLRALASNKNDRFQSAKEFGEQISDYLFKHNIRVDSYQISEFIEKQLSVTKSSPNRVNIQKIQSMIKDEILNLSMVGSIGFGNNQNLKPIDIAELKFNKLKDKSNLHKFLEIEDADLINESDLINKESIRSLERTNSFFNSPYFWVIGILGIIVIMLILYIFLIHLG